MTFGCGEKWSAAAVYSFLIWPSSRSLHWAAIPGRLPAPTGNSYKNMIQFTKGLAWTMQKSKCYFLVPVLVLHFLEPPQICKWNITQKYKTKKYIKWHLCFDSMKSLQPINTPLFQFRKHQLTFHRPHVTRTCTCLSAFRLRFLVSE